MVTTVTAIVMLITTALIVCGALVIARRVTAPVGPTAAALSRPMPTALRNRMVSGPLSPTFRATAGRADGLSLREAEDILDWLEATGCGAGKLSLDGQRFTVVWNE